MPKTLVAGKKEGENHCLVVQSMSVEASPPASLTFHISSRSCAASSGGREMNIPAGGRSVQERGDALAAERAVAAPASSFATGGSLRAGLVGGGRRISTGGIARSSSCKALRGAVREGEE